MNALLKVFGFVAGCCIAGVVSGAAAGGGSIFLADEIEEFLRRSPSHLVESAFDATIAMHYQAYFNFFMSPQGLWFVYSEFTRAYRLGGKESWFSSTVFSALWVLNERAKERAELKEDYVRIEALLDGLVRYRKDIEGFVAALNDRDENATLFRRVWKRFGFARKSYRHYATVRCRQLWYLETFFLFFMMTELVSAPCSSLEVQEVLSGTLSSWLTKIATPLFKRSWDVNAIVFALSKIITAFGLPGRVCAEYATIYTAVLTRLASKLSYLKEAQIASICGLDGTPLALAVVNALKIVGVTISGFSSECFAVLMSWYKQAGELGEDLCSHLIQAVRSVEAVILRKAATGSPFTLTIARL